MSTTDETAAIDGDLEPPVRGRAPHAEFMQIWEEGYLNRRSNYEDMHLPNVSVYEGGPMRQEDGKLDRIKILAYLEAVYGNNPAYRLRLQRSALGLTSPAWVPDEDFDLSRHVLFADSAVDYATADLRKLAGEGDGAMPIEHPLWRIRVTELTDGRVAIGSIGHHSTSDGLTGMRTMSALNQKSPDAPVPAPIDPFAGLRAPGAWELPGLALRQWWAALPEPKLRNGWRAYWAKPVHRRARRVVARNLLPYRFDRGDRRAQAVRAALPPRHSAYRRLDAAAVGRNARRLGGTMSDLLISSIIGAWEGPERIVRLRFPVSFHAVGEPKTRNNVRDMLITGDADAALEVTMPSVHAQVADRDRAWDGHEVPGYPIGYGTLLPYLSRPGYFCGGELLEMTPFPASLPTDQLAAAAIMYNGSLFVGANMPVTADVERTIDRIAELMSPPPGTDGR
ncbi:hypothetical protein ET445_16490 [Agromyces protaetiae]|uniref:O-acyltransferase WSD1-like N-terminal domain-containing protein n=1 Tax=Agromyces protaetiae TaxID=2509455 RepID=A0A4P6FFG9_9MICO|nr:wax ester/triacylglycerol synthase domain-containing protein [Agromyces protaetiae]QAY74695.1 hypothetical protein ET445_16490 [Agromyces protaetiae]